MADNTGATAEQATGGTGATGSGGTSSSSGADRLREGFQEKVVDPARRAGEAMRDSGKKIAENSSSLGVAVIDQAAANAQEAFSAMRAAARASDLTEVMRIQGEYLRDQGKRSMDQAREIGDLIMKFGRDAVSPLRGGKDGEK